MWDRLTDLAFAGLLAAAGLVGVGLVARRWAPRARARDGRWLLEFSLLAGGPVSAALIFVYPVAPHAVQSLNRAVVLACIAAAALMVIEALRSGTRSGIAGVVAIVLAFYGVLLLSGLGGAAPGTIPEVYWSTPLVLLSFILTGQVTLAWFLRLLRSAVRLTMVLSLLALVVLPDLAFNHDEPRELFGVERFQGITGHPNTLAIIALVGLLLELVQRSWAWSAVMIAALLFSQSHTVWITTGLALACLTGAVARVIRVVVAAAVASALVLAIFNAAAFAPVVADLGGEGGFSLNGRTRIWAAALEGFHQFPLLGYGPTLLDDRYRAVYLPNFAAAAQSHSQWVQSLSSTGLVGLATAIAFVVVVIVLGARRRRATAGLSLAIPLAFVLRTATETPLDPFGPSLGTMVVLAVIVPIAFAPRLLRSGGGVTTEDEDPGADLAEPTAPSGSRQSVKGDSLIGAPVIGTVGAGIMAGRSPSRASAEKDARALS